MYLVLKVEIILLQKIIENIFKKQTIKISSNPKNKTKNKIYTYILKKKFKTKEKNILLSNLGYNFDQISKKFFKKKI